MIGLGKYFVGDPDVTGAYPVSTVDSGFPDTGSDVRDIDEVDRDGVVDQFQHASDIGRWSPTDLSGQTKATVERMPARSRKLVINQEHSGFVSKKSHVQAPESKGFPIDVFFGTIDRIDGEVAFVTLVSNNGETFYGERDATDFLQNGLSEGDRFTCEFFSSNGTTRVKISPIAPKSILKEFVEELDIELSSSIDF